MHPVLSSDRLVLRPYTETQRAEFVALNSDPIVREHVNGPLPREAAEALFDRILARAPEASSRAWAILAAAGGHYLGHLFLDAETGEPDPELGFLLKREFWGMGFATEAVKRILDDLRASSPFSRVFATADIGHSASIHVLEKAGFRFVESRSDEHGPYGFYRWIR